MECEGISLLDSDFSASSGDAVSPSFVSSLSCAIALMDTVSITLVLENLFDCLAEDGILSSGLVPCCSLLERLRLLP